MVYFDALFFAGRPISSPPLTLFTQRLLKYFSGASSVMPNIKSVIKDVKRSRVRQLRNQAAKSQIKTFMKKSRAAIADTAAQPADVSASVSKTISVIDKAWKRGIIHKNAAARRKSRLMKSAAKSAQA
jgi:small subunit ribosomal protein S20